MRELHFEWDEDKAAANLIKHGVSFLTAAALFANEIVEQIDDREDYREVRYIGLNSTCTGLFIHGEMMRSSASSAPKRPADMSGSSTTVKRSLSEIEAMRARGEDETRPDAPEAESLGKDFWKKARVVMPRGKTSVHLRLDTDIVEWFRARGKGHLTRMNAVLRAYVAAHKKTS